MTGGGSATAQSLRPAGAAEWTRELYVRHGQRVYSFCASRLRNSEEAQDAAQTTFVYVLSALDRGVVPRNELAWLLTIADNVCRSTRRSLGRRLARLVDTDVDELEAAATSIGAETNETLDALTAAIGDLPANQRQAILLREWQGLSYADIADRLGLSVAAVETLLFRARRSLAARLERSPARLRGLNLGSLLAAVRSFFEWLAGKLALGVAGVALVVGVPGGVYQVQVAGRPLAPHRVAVAVDASGERSALTHETAGRGSRSAPATTRAHRARSGGRRPVVRRRPTPAPAAQTPAPAPAPPPAPGPAPAGAPGARPGPIVVTPPASVPPAPPVPVPAAAQPVVATAAQTVGRVVSTVANAVPPPPALPPLK
jgi:RNA polymerase sigma-70 factor (ECF subfamily)